MKLQRGVRDVILWADRGHEEADRVGAERLQYVSEYLNNPKCVVSPDDKAGLEAFRAMSESEQSEALREATGLVGPLSREEAIEALVEAVRGGLFGPTRDVDRRVQAAGFTSAHDWIDDRLEQYDHFTRGGR
jgi:hypothetical protein